MLIGENLLDSFSVKGTEIRWVIDRPLPPNMYVGTICSGGVSSFMTGTFPSLLYTLRDVDKTSVIIKIGLYYREEVILISNKMGSGPVPDSGPVDLRDHDNKRGWSLPD